MKIKHSKLLPVIVQALLITTGTGCLSNAPPVEAKSNVNSSQNTRELTANASVPAPQLIGKSSNMIDGISFIDKCKKASDSYTDYSFDYTQTVYKSKKPAVETGTVWAKKPLLKVVVKSGSKAGCIAVLQANGQVRARGSGAFGLITVTLSPDSDMLRSANGWPMAESDFSSIWKAMQGYAKEGCPAKVSQDAVDEPSQTSKVYVLEMTKQNGQMYKRALINPQTTLPVEWWDYQNGQVYAHSLWNDFKGNQGLSDAFFNTHRNKGDK